MFFEKKKVIQESRPDPHSVSRDALAEIRIGDIIRFPFFLGLLLIQPVAF